MFCSVVYTIYQVDELCDGLDITEDSKPDLTNIYPAKLCNREQIASQVSRRKTYLGNIAVAITNTAGFSKLFTELVDYKTVPEKHTEMLLLARQDNYNCKCI